MLHSPYEFQSNAHDQITLHQSWRIKLTLIHSRGDCKRPCFDQLHAHILERQKKQQALLANQNIAAHNCP